MINEVLADELSIGEMAAASGLSVHTLRYYERIGLIAPIPRLSSGHRRYSRETVERVESLGYLRAAGLSMDDMRIYLANLDRGDLAAADHAALLSAHARSIDEQVEQLRLRQAYIEAKAAYWQAVADGKAQTAAAQRTIRRARELSQRLR
ncbi:MerR family transcriptional regulator [Jatrophihabitans sp.]|uniref:MerR family transcriptional regulator n=1 Tax=Jatrophihabitans sp. TaxID=1932789 RepID=UPI0030C73BED|nr:MerR family transcriptional regulator [Jatrophihabitans sp.]